MAHKYKDNPETLFSALISTLWVGFGVTIAITLIVALASNKKRPGYHARVIQLAGMPVITLIAIGFTYFVKSSFS
ncbi:hypothetical protein [Acinetobacter baumannii]|uniref:hypothetical protein n=1 Tax=Acinetobacter baumannii TaxID=470 RepID=UPI001D18655F|nr:hypothetical protein [Acinetobacter baumannii]